MTDNRVGAAAVLALAGLALVGCAPQPSLDEIEERFAIEIAGVYNGERDDSTVRDFARKLSETAAEDCFDATLWRLVTTGVDDVRWDADLQYIHAASCSVLYGDSLGDDLADDYARVIADHVSATLTD